MWQPLFLSQVLKAVDDTHVVEYFHLQPFITQFVLLSPHRYHKLVWGPYGMDSQGHPSGVLVAGGENGNVILYDPAKIMAGDTNVIIAESDKHTGPVRALDVNPFQVRSV